MKFKELIKKYYDQIGGGIGDTTLPNNVDKKELFVGIFVEKEHTNDLYKSTSIAIDHLTENNKYYSELIERGMVDEPTALIFGLNLLKVKPKNSVNLEDMEAQATDADLMGSEETTPEDAVDAMGDGEEGEAAEEITDDESTDDGEEDVLWGKMNKIGEPEADEIVDNYKPRGL